MATLDLEPDLTSAGMARHWVREHLDRWELSEATDVAMLLVSELVTNAVVHAGSGARLVLAVADGTVEVGVTDDEGRWSRHEAPHPATGGPVAADHLLAEGGRGLLLIDALAEERGTVILTHGKQVWFRIDARHWSYLSACRCHSDDLSRVRLESGRYALAIPGPWDAPPTS